ncbi:MAG: hypothetical protein M3Q56_04005 [Bacteroidota bacterium]|nr:hypothetical protein [Bacteroidota bacterium]
MAIWPFIIIRSQALSNDRVLINHEKIHLRQQIELLLVFFYIIYFLEYVTYRIKGLNSLDSYCRISFEREAYEHENDMNYLKQRNHWVFLKYYKLK